MLFDFAYDTVPTTTTTTTTTTKQTTQASTRNPSDADLCKGRMRIWSECVGNPPTRFTTDGCVSSKNAWFTRTKLKNDKLFLIINATMTLNRSRCHNSGCAFIINVTT